MLLRLFPLLLLAPPLAAQNLEHPGPTTPHSVSEACAAGDFNGDGLQDMALLDSAGRVDVLMGIGLYGFLIPDVFDVNNTTINDLAILSEDGEDQIVAVGSGGVLHTNWDEASLGFGAHTVIASGSFWTNAAQVAVTEDAGQPSVVGLKANGTTIRRRTRTAPQTWTDSFVVQLSAAALDLQMIDLYDDGGDEIAVLKAHSVEFWSLEGTLDSSFNAFGAQFMSVVEHPDREMLAVVTNLNPTWLLALYGVTTASPGAGSPQLASWSILGDNLQLTGIASGQAGATGGASMDALGDLAVSSHATTTIAQMWNVGSTTSAAFNLAADSVLLGYATSVTDPVAPPCLVDMDNDGDDDATILDNTSGNFVVIPNDAIDADSLRPSASLLDPILSEDGGLVSLNASVRVDSSLFDPDRMLQVTLYKYDVSTGLAVDYEHNKYHEFPGEAVGNEYQFPIELELEQTTGGCFEFDSVYALAVRLIDVDANRTERLGVLPTRMILFQNAYDDPGVPGPSPQYTFVQNFATAGGGAGTASLFALCTGTIIGQVGSYGTGPGLPGPPTGGQTPGNPNYP